MPRQVVRGFAALPDTRIYYEVYGQGPTVLLLHGNGEDLHVFDAMVAALEGRYQVVALDTRGHGKSGRGTKPFCFETFAGDVASVLEALGIASAHVVGYSDGGNTGMYTALAYPQKVASLVLLGANLNPGGMSSLYQLSIAAAYGVECVLGRIRPKRKQKAEMLEIMARHPNLTPSQIAGISAPTLVLAGEKDMIRRSHTKQIAAGIPKASISILPGTNHFDLPKSPATIGRVTAFLNHLTRGQESIIMKL